jgi:hypothetical protein
MHVSNSRVDGRRCGAFAQHGPVQLAIDSPWRRTAWWLLCQLAGPAPGCSGSVAALAGPWASAATRFLGVRCCQRPCAQQTGPPGTSHPGHDGAADRPYRRLGQTPGLKTHTHHPWPLGCWWWVRVSRIRASCGFCVRVVGAGRRGPPCSRNHWRYRYWQVNRP